MKQLKAVLLMPDPYRHKTCTLAATAGIQLNAAVASDLVDLEQAFSIRQDLLLAFGTGVIVPASILKTPNLLAVNVHAASPLYPGRDPHHFAVYDGVKEYGATMHYMTPSVDAGPIIDVELFAVPDGVTPASLLSLATEAGLSLITRFFQTLAEDRVPTLDRSQSWGSRKTTRKMFRELCRIDPDMPLQEFERRFRAAAMPGYGNLYIDLHGHRFHIEASPT